MSRNGKYDDAYLESVCVCVCLRGWGGWRLGIRAHISAPGGPVKKVWIPLPCSSEISDSTEFF